MAGSFRSGLAILAKPPSFERPISQACGQAQMSSPAYRYWCARLGLPPDHFYRGYWEMCYIAQALAIAGMLAPGRRGWQPEATDPRLARLFQGYGCDILLTQSDPAALDRLRADQPPSMPAMPQGRLEIALRQTGQVFDFIWSMMTISTLGSLPAGRDYVLNCLTSLAPGGVAIFSTEFNCRALAPPATTNPILWRRGDILALLDHLAKQGYDVVANIYLGDGPADLDIDEPPFRFTNHLRLRIGDQISTSYGMLIRKAS
jgi:hypothetical protein